MARFMLAMVGVGCDGNEGAPPDGATTIDAAVADAATADAAVPDGPPIDGLPIDAMPIDAMPIDAMPIDAMPIDARFVAPCDTTGTGAIQVVTRAGATIVAHDIDGVPVAMTTADVQGLARCVVPVGGMVTVASATAIAGTYELVTLLDVRAGESITLLPLPSPPTPSVVGTLAVDYQPFAGASTYEVAAGFGCTGSGASPIAASVTSACTGTDGAPAVLAFATEVGTRLAFASSADVTLTAPGPTAVSLPAWRTDFVDIQSSVQNVPAEIGEVLTRIDLVDDRVLFACGTGMCVDNQQDADTTVDLAYRVPVFGDGIRLNASFANTSGHEAGLDRLARVYPAFPSTIDATSELLPHVTSQTRSGTADRPIVSWILAAAPTAADALMVFHNWNQPGGANWMIVAPPETPSPVRYPELPAGVGPTGTPRDSAVMIMDASWLADHAAFRSDPFRPMYDFNTQPAMREVGGVFRYSSTGDSNYP